jgi:NAD(P)-dependent dehydrogenase (short-subunit alcohol dehydrogenase family)
MSRTTFDFTGEKVVIAGGTSGMGLATACHILDAGGTAVVVGRTQDSIDQAAKVLENHGKFYPLAADLADPKAVDALRTVLTEDHADATGLVGAAGIFEAKDFLKHEYADYDSYAALNRAHFFITQTVVGNMITRGVKGSIVLYGSMWAKQAVGATPSSAYSMMKAGLHALTKNLAIEFGLGGVRVNAIAPAVVRTPIFGRGLTEAELDAALVGYGPFHPLGRIGVPDDIANPTLFLLSDASSWITGTVLDVDGGVMAGRN